MTFGGRTWEILSHSGTENGGQAATGPEGRVMLRAEARQAKRGHGCPAPREVSTRVRGQ